MGTQQKCSFLAKNYNSQILTLSKQCRFGRFIVWNEYFQNYIRQKEKDVRNVLGEYAGSILGLLKIEKPFDFLVKNEDIMPQFFHCLLLNSSPKKWLSAQN